MGYTIVVELQDIEHDETTRLYYGYFESFKDLTPNLERMREEVESCPEDPDSNRLVDVNWRAIRMYNNADVAVEVTTFINKGRRK